MFDKRALWTMLGPKNDEVTGDSVKVHDEVLRNFYSPSINQAGPGATPSKP
jgi:hypothetical protein